MILPIVRIPSSVSAGLSPYADLFPRRSTYQHIQEYCTGMVVLERPSILRLSECLVDGPCQSSLNKAITRSPWDADKVQERRLECIRPHHQQGFRVGILDTTFLHHPRGQHIYGVYRYWDYVEGHYTYALRLVTSAISTGNRVDGFDTRIYHRSFQQQEQLYLEHTPVPPSATQKEPYLRRLTELLCYQAHRQEAQTQNELAEELIDSMEASGMAPHAYALDSGLFAPDIIAAIEQYGKPWVADSEKNRVLYYKGQRFHCESFEKSLPEEAFREISLKIHGQKRTYWVFSCCVRIHRYGKVRLVIFYQNPGRQGKPKYVFTKKLVWNATKILSVRLRRWDIEPLHEQSKQFQGAEDSQLRTEAGVRRHLTLVLVVNSLLQSLDLSSPIGELSMDWPKDVQPTFGHRCRRIFLEVFHDLVERIHHELTQHNKTVPQIFQTLFQRLLYA